MRKSIPQSFDDKGRPETAPEYSRRIQDQLDNDSWQGRDTVGNIFPEPAEIVEYDPPAKNVIFRRKAGI